MISRHPALGQYTLGPFDPGYVDVYESYPVTQSPSTLQYTLSSASNMAAQGVSSGAPLDVTMVQAGGAAATAVVATTASAVTAAIAIPVIGAAVAAVTFWIMRNRVENIRKEKATEIVNQAEAKMKENLEAYMSGPRTVSSQRQAISNFDALWDFIVQGCTAVGGDAGRRCIEERQQGGTAPWCPTGTGCDYFTLYRDPIAKDQARPDDLNAVLDPVTGQLVPASGFGFSGLLIAALMGTGLFLMATKKGDDD